MPGLRELQQGFVADLLGDSSSHSGAFIHGGRFEPAARLQVYRNNVITSLREALRDVHPVVARLVGDGFFAYAAHEYVRAHPSRSGNLHEFGVHFSEFLAGFEPANELPYLPDVARLEWSWHRAFHAAEHAPLSLERLASVPALQHESLRFRLHPSVTLLASRYPVVSIWEMHQQADGEPSGTLDLALGAQRALVSRPGADVRVEAIGQSEFDFLDALARQRPLGEACEQALQAGAELDLAQVLQRRVRDRSIVDFH